MSVKGYFSKTHVKYFSTKIGLMRFSLSSDAVVTPIVTFDSMKKLIRS